MSDLRKKSKNSDLLSTSSSVPETYKSSSLSNINASIMEDINSLIGQAGGAKKRRGSKSKKGSKEAKLVKSISKKGSKKGSMKGGAKKRSTKKSSKKSSKKGSRRGKDATEGAKRKPNDFMVVMFSLKKKIKAKDSSINDGPALSKVVSAVMKNNDRNESASMAELEKMSKTGDLHKKLKAAKNEMDANKNKIVSMDQNIRQKYRR